MTDKIDVTSIVEFSEVMDNSSASVADDLSKMTSEEMEVEIQKLRFLEGESFSNEIGYEDVVCVYCRLDDPPHGVFVVTFTPEDAATVAGFMMDGLPEEYGSQHEAVVQEIGNIMTSGFIDGIANLLDTSIEITTPTVFDGEAEGVADHLMNQVSMQEPGVFVLLNTYINAVEHDVECKAFLLPDAEEFADIVESVPDVSLEAGGDGDNPF